MGTRTHHGSHASASGSLRDYRTLTLPAVMPTEDDWRPSTGLAASAVSTARQDDPHHGRAVASPVLSRPTVSTRSAVRVRRTIAPLRLDDLHLDTAPGIVIPARTSQHREPSRATARMRTTRVMGTVIESAPQAKYHGKLLAAAQRVEPLRSRATTTVRIGGKSVPLWMLANLAIFVALALGVAVPRLASVDAASACNWHTVVPGDTLGNLGWKHHTTALALARANHIANPNLIYVGQRLCIPMSSTAQASSARGAGGAGEVDLVHRAIGQQRDVVR